MMHRALVAGLLLTFLFMGVVGILVASLGNLWLKSSALQFAISAIGVLVFAGLTAYDTQRIKDGYYQVMGDTMATSKAAIMGALSLYLDFINMFTMLLSLFGIGLTVAAPSLRMLSQMF